MDKDGRLESGGTPAPFARAGGDADADDGLAARNASDGRRAGFALSRMRSTPRRSRRWRRRRSCHPCSYEPSQFDISFAGTCAYAAKKHTFDDLGVRLAMEALHESRVPLDLPRKLARACGVALAHRPLALLLEAAALGIGEARPRAEDRDLALGRRELALGVDRGRDRVERDRGRGAAVRERRRDRAHLARAAVALVVEQARGGDVRVRARAWGAAPPLVVLALPLALPLAVSLRAAAVAAEGDEADALRGVWGRLAGDCSRHTLQVLMLGLGDKLAGEAEAGGAVDELREEVGEEESEGGAENGAHCLCDVAEADEIDHKFDDDTEDGDDDNLGKLGECVVDEDALEEAVEEEVWSGGCVCWVGDNGVDEDACAEGEKERETSRELHKVRTGVRA